jgi:tetratricopeptide (TPR) repeat protein
MADHVLPSQDKSKFSLWLQKFTTFIQGKALLIGAAFMVIGITAVVFKFIHLTPHEKAVNIVKQANQNVEQGKFNEAIQDLLRAYNTETITTNKAGIAYKLGVKYYQTGSRAEGKKWLETAAADYEKAGDKDSAAAAKQQIVTLEGAQKINNINDAANNNNAVQRGNIQDGNL